MALRAVAPKQVEKRLKLFEFGNAGVGKTFAAIQFPRPYLIDTERGAENEQYVTALEAAGGAYYFTTDLEEIIKEVRALLTEKHEYRTLVIDPLTIPYNNACENAARSLANPAKGIDGTEFGRHKALADRRVKVLCELLLQLDMNVIITSHAKIKWEKVGDDFKQTGTTFDCYGKLEYLFDLVIEVQKRGMERVGIVRKTRVASFPEGEVFPFNYAKVADMYGREVLERQAVQVELASAEQVARLTQLVEALHIPNEDVEKWMDKANAESFAEFPATVAATAITNLEKKIQTPAPAAA